MMLLGLNLHRSMDTYPDFILFITLLSSNPRPRMKIQMRETIFVLCCICFGGRLLQGSIAQFPTMNPTSPFLNSRNEQYQSIFSQIPTEFYDLFCQIKWGVFKS